MLRYMTAGESHGKALVAIVGGMPAGLSLDENFINSELARRMEGYGRGARMKIEKDKVEIISGCRKGVTLGSPVAMLIENKDYTIDKLPEVKCPRPGHADLAGMQKYGFSDARSVLERASARETAARTAVGAVMKLILAEFGIKIQSRVISLGGITIGPESEEAMREAIDEARKAGDTLGGSFEVIIDGVPPGLGSYAEWDRRLDSILSGLIMSIPAVKAVSLGKGIECASKRGSQTHDPIRYNSSEKMFTRESNNAGGIEGGMTNGMPVVIKGFMKPIATLNSPLVSVNVDTKETMTAGVERSDVCAVLACSVIAEAVSAFGIAAAFLEKFGNDSMADIRRGYEAYIKRLKAM
ncbi:MAG: chorismate synthase [Candidatus Omnitrophota bacterium]